MSIPTLNTTCPVVKSRIMLTDAVANGDDACTCTYRECSNVLNCFFRSDYQDQIPECLLHQAHPLA